MNHLSTLQFPAQIAEVESAGGKVTDRYREVLARYESFIERKSITPDDVADAVIRGESEERIRELYSMSVAVVDASHTGIADITNRTKARIIRELKSEYATVADSNLKLIADQFDKAWKDFTKLAKVIDPETPAQNVVGVPAEDSNAWLRAPELALLLDRLANAHSVAAELVGINAKRIDLLISADGSTRSVWFAFHDEVNTRCGKWSALAKAEAQVNAVGNATQALGRNWQEPQSVTKQVQTKVGPGIWGARNVLVDAVSGEEVER